MRKVAVQVPDVVSRLLRAQVIAPPAWYQPSLSHPPLPLPPRQLSPSASTSQPRLFKSRNNQVKHLRTKKNRPREIVYEVDVIRRRFFEDYPFEALRPVSLVEGRTINEDVGVEGEAWTELAQRGEYPTVENAIAYIANLHTHFHMSLSQAYSRGCEQFDYLRSINEIATFAAETEARHNGAKYKKNVFERFAELETAALASNAPPSLTITTSAASTPQPRQPWTPILLPSQKTTGPFVGGGDYITRWARWESMKQKEKEAKEQLLLMQKKSVEEQVHGESVVAASADSEKVQGASMST